MLLAVVGSGVIEPTNHDFRTFGFPLLNVVLFLALFPLFGLGAVWAIGWLAPMVPEIPLKQRPGLRAGAAFVLLGVSLVLGMLFLGLGVIASVRAVLGASEDKLFRPGLLLFALLGLRPGTQAVVTPADRGRGRSGHGLARWPVSWGSTCLLVLVLLVGLAHTAHAVWTILQPGF